MREWLEFYDLEPWGAWRDNFHAATIAQTVAQTVQRKGGQRIDPQRFFYEDATTRQERRDGAALLFFERKADGND